MNRWDGIDPIRARLRVLVKAVGDEVARLRTSERGENELEQAWVGLVAALDLGPEPEVRSCPFCRRAILRLAVRCRYCMKSSPVESSAARE